MINKKLLNFLPEAKRYMMQTVFWNWFCMLLNVGLVFMIGSIFQSLYDGKKINIGYYGIGFTLVIILRFLGQKMAVRNTWLASKDVKGRLRDMLYSKVMSFGGNYNDKMATSELLQLSMEGVEQLENYFGKYIPQFFYSLLAPVTLFAILSFVSLRASVVLLICVPLIPVSIVAVQKFAKRLLNKYWGIYTGLGDSFLENLQGLTTLKIYQADKQKADEMDVEAENFRRITMKVLTMQLNSISIMDLIAYGGAAAGIVTAVFQFRNGGLSIFGMTAILLLSAEFFIPLRLLGSFFHIAMNGVAASDKIFRFLELENAEAGTKTISAIAGIKIKNLSFSYEEGQSVLKQIHMEIPKDGFVSIVGESGCGKSTIASLLMGRQTSYEGNLMIGDTEIKDITLANLMETVTLVAHNSYLFKGTVRENLSMGDRHATDEQMYTALKKVCLYDFFIEMEGLDTLLAERAANLSGGQCQRLAMARALLRDTPMYIFDEATSNIDIESENMIMKVLHELARNKMVILISHRLENVRQCDRIYMMDKGKIAEQGTHLELMAKGSTYACLYNRQKQLESYGADEDTKGGKAYA